MLRYLPLGYWKAEPWEFSSESRGCVLDIDPVWSWEQEVWDFFGLSWLCIGGGGCGAYVSVWFEPQFL